MAECCAGVPAVQHPAGTGQCEAAGV